VFGSHSEQSAKRKVWVVRGLLSYVMANPLGRKRLPPPVM